MFKINFWCWYVTVLFYVQLLWFWSDLISYSTKLNWIYGNATCTRCESLCSSEAGPLSLDNLVFPFVCHKSGQNPYPSNCHIWFLLVMKCILLLLLVCLFTFQTNWNTLSVSYFHRSSKGFLTYFKTINGCKSKEQIKAIRNICKIIDVRWIADQSNRYCTLGGL